MADWLAEQGSPVSACTPTLLGDPRVVRERGAHDIAILAYTAYAKEQTAIAEQLLKAGVSVHARALNATAFTWPPPRAISNWPRCWWSMAPTRTSR